MSQDVLREEIRQEEESLQNSQSAGGGGDYMDVSSGEAAENEEEQTQILQRSREEVLANIEYATSSSPSIRGLHANVMPRIVPPRRWPSRPPI